MIDRLYNTMFFSVDIDLVYILIIFSKMQKERQNNLNVIIQWFFSVEIHSLSQYKKGQIIIHTFQDI